MRWLLRFLGVEHQLGQILEKQMNYNTGYHYVKNQNFTQTHKKSIIRFKVNHKNNK